MLNLQDFYLAIIDRRIKIITHWIKLNLPNDESLNETLKRQMQRYLEVCHSRYFKPLRGLWKICKSSCRQRKDLDTPCLRLCIRLADLCECNKNDCDRCNCLEQNHLCDEPCFYCLRGRECDSKRRNLCGIGAKHKGNHNCRKTKHLCSEICSKRDYSHGCNTYCQHSIVDVHHDHVCDAQHKCIEDCSAPDCSSHCNLDLAHAVSDLAKAHDCGKKHCLVKCHIEGCNLICIHSDHFHDLGAVVHFCNKKKHLCIGSDSMCSVEVGRCSSKQTFGKLPCALVIQAGRLDHVGPHYCKTDHVCDEQCPCGCLEYCIIQLELKENESTGQRAFRAHNGACNTSSHTFSNRTEKEFKEAIKQLSLNAHKSIQTGAITMEKNTVKEHLHSFEEPKNTVSDSNDQFYGLHDAGLKLCDWSQEESATGRLRVLSSTADLLIRQYRTNFSTSRNGNDKE